MSRYQEMQVFAAVAQAGSLAAAARLLDLSSATVMRSVAALEARLNTVLLVRSPRGVSLSPTGEAFAASCRQILQGVLEAERSVLGLHSDPVGQLTLSAPLLMTPQVLLPITLGYLDAFPEVQVVTQSHDGIPRLLDEGIDIALVVGPLPNSSGFAIPVGTVRPVVCGAPGYLAQRGRPATPDDLRQHRLVTATSAGYVEAWRFRQGHAVQWIKPQPVLSCTTQQAAIRAAIAGLGLTRCLNHEVHQELQAGQLEAVLCDAAPEGLPVNLIYREGRRATVRVRTFLDFAVPQLRAHPAFNH
ncbi:MAG: LysR family transcriptional regulator [Pseudomonas sp.]|uniref:LysR family transcriptional regulator n=1 Tax=Pseudomonas sp. TaxID=306 RepID=UPI003D0C41FE